MGSGSPLASASATVCCTCSSAATEVLHDIQIPGFRFVHRILLMLAAGAILLGLGLAPTSGTPLRRKKSQLTFIDATSEMIPRGEHQLPSPLCQMTLAQERTTSVHHALLPCPSHPFSTRSVAPPTRSRCFSATPPPLLLSASSPHQYPVEYSSRSLRKMQLAEKVRSNPSRGRVIVDRRCEIRSEHSLLTLKSSLFHQQPHLTHHRKA